jgi:glycosyltransferase involved in cell wall biosynthesis
MQFILTFEGRLKLIHCPIAGIVPAENAGLKSAKGDIVALIDDDAVAADNWLSNHLRHYDDEAIGAVGGPALNHTPSGDRFPVQRVKRIGKLAWYGKFVGNLNDSVLEHENGAIAQVDGLAGNNMSLRRVAFEQFEENMRDYWQLFELEVCLQVRMRGFKVIFDFCNPVLHYPVSRNKVYDGTREGNLTQKFFNSAYNHAFILSKYTKGALRVVRLFYLLTISSVPFPGPIKYPLTVWRYGHPAREFRIMVGTLKAHLKGWQDGKCSVK